MPRCIALLGACAGLPPCLHSQQRDSVHDTLKVYTLPPAVVSVTRSNASLRTIPLAVQLVESRDVNRGKPTWGLDEALEMVPGVYAANRYNFSLDQRISIRGFGARSAFAVRGIKVLLDGIPQTLPDGQGQLTNVELGSINRIEVLRGASSALFGNASGGVISLWTDAPPPSGVTEDVRVQAGAFDSRLARAWTKWQSGTAFPIGAGTALVTLSRLAYDGERDHSAADFRNLNTSLTLPLDDAWSLALTGALGWDPRADNPGSLTASQLAASPTQADSANVATDAGKAVTQGQGGVTLRRRFAGGGEATVSAFGFTRALRNPLSYAYIDVDRVDYGTRFTITRPLPLGSLAHRLTAGFDLQRQHDARRNYGNNGGAADTAVRTLDQLERVTEVGPFLQSAIDVTRQLTLTGGLRYDRVAFSVGDHLVDSVKARTNQIYLDDSGRRVMARASWSLGVTESPSDALTTYASVGTSFETPTTTELANRPDTAGGFNNDLEPQTATSCEVGVRAHLPRASLSVALFQADVTNELISYGITGSRRRFFRNAGSARHRGIEAGARVALVPGLDLIAAYSLADYRYARYRFASVNGAAPPDTTVHVLDGRALPGVPRHWLHVIVSAGRGSRHRIWGEIEETYSSSYFVDDTLGLRASPWARMDLRAGWEGHRFAPFLAIENLFDRRYVGSVVINDAGGRYFEPAPGRNVYLGVTVGAGR